ncbi:protein Rep [Paenibacillus sp. CGMCC 1.18879]|uniref:rolling circle replication-associated protein n=1 Tax=Paenibacillus sp. CGMCC 1.18879 TaxID=2834466 RepID=UPI001CA9A9B2|nr:protein Rep [Paenibacillus sp. CGMCC 1.18879]MBY9082359.1 protein Rep [Paenibacillus sp. CGMCC 1.18879]
MKLGGSRVSEDFPVQKKYRKMVVTGNVIEVYEMESKPYQLFRKYQDGNKPDWLAEWEAEIKSRTLEERVASCDTLRDAERLVRDHVGREQRNITRTRNNVRRLALANFDNGSKFVTFTFAKNITEISVANQEWKSFIKRLRYKYGRFKYMAVLEFQKRGAVHYHCIWDLPYIRKSELAEIWGQGHIKVNRIDHVDNVGAYIVKYMTKDLMDERFVGSKAYQCSKGLDRPIVLRDEELDVVWQLYDLEHRKTAFESSYTSEHHGLIIYKEYNLKRVVKQEVT